MRARRGGSSAGASTVPGGAAAVQALLVGKRKVFLESITEVLQQHSTWPQLYIYSASDHVIPHASVKAWAKVRRLPRAAHA